MDNGTGIGARVKRKEDQRFITGKGNYTDDLKLAGMTHAVFVRSPHAHARIRSIDVSKAKAMPGVKAILTVDDLPPVEALAMFYEYRELTPIGRRGDQRVQILFGAVVGIDVAKVSGGITVVTVCAGGDGHQPNALHA